MLQVSAKTAIPHGGPDLGEFLSNWLQVLDPAELAQIDQCVRQQLHAIMPLLDAFKA